MNSDCKYLFIQDLSVDFSTLLMFMPLEFCINQIRIIQIKRVNRFDPHLCRWPTRSECSLFWAWKPWLWQMLRGGSTAPSMSETSCSSKTTSICRAWWDRTLCVVTTTRGSVKKTNQLEQEEGEKKGKQRPHEPQSLSSCVQVWGSLPVHVWRLRPRFESRGQTDGSGAGLRPHPAGGGLLHGDWADVRDRRWVQTAADPRSWRCW